MFSDFGSRHLLSTDTIPMLCKQCVPFYNKIKYIELTHEVIITVSALNFRVLMTLLFSS